MRPGQAQFIELSDKLVKAEKEKAFLFPSETLEELSLSARFNKRRAFRSLFQQHLARLMGKGISQERLLECISHNMAAICSLSSKKHIDIGKVNEQSALAVSRISDDNTLISRLSEVVSEAFTHEYQELSPKEISDLTAEYIEQGYRRELSISQISKLLGFDSSYLSKIFKQERGCSPKSYLTTCRIDAAKRTFKEQRHLSIQEVGMRVGYRDPHYFSRVFRKWVGLSPSDFIRRIDPVPDSRERCED